MPRKPKDSSITYEVTGIQPVTVNGETRYPGDTFKARAADVRFLHDIGAVREAKPPKKDSGDDPAGKD